MRAVGYTTGPFAPWALRASSSLWPAVDGDRSDRLRLGNDDRPRSWRNGGPGSASAASLRLLAGGVVGVACAVVCLWWIMRTCRGSPSGACSPGCSRQRSRRPLAPVDLERPRFPPSSSARWASRSSWRAGRMSSPRPVRSSARARACSPHACAWPPSHCGGPSADRSMGTAGRRWDGWGCGMPPIVPVEAFLRSP